VNAALVNIPVWVIGSLVGPLVLPIPAGPVWAIAIFAIGTLTALAFYARRPRSAPQIAAALLITQLTVGIALGALAVVTGLFDRFAAFLFLFAAVNGLAVQRLPFLLAIVAVTGHLTIFLVVGLAVGADGLLIQAFLLASALAILTTGNYMVEDAERREFAQGRLIAALHRQVDDLLHRYLAPDVADTLLREPDRARLGGDELVVTILFADLTGFTTYSERVEPREAVAMLNDRFGRAVPEVVAEGGTIVQFAGDAMMVVFGAPAAQPDHALRAVRAALGLQSATTELDPAGTSGGPRFRVGITTGPALVGNIGGGEVQSFTAIGDTTNLAARLQTFAPPGSVVISETTLAEIGEGALVRALGTPELKGKHTPVAVYELLGLREVPAPASRPSAPSNATDPIATDPIATD
jgi:class 3 adenylate cyclase